MAGFPGCSRWLLVVAVAAASAARGARADDTSARLAGYEAEVRQLAADLPRPNQISGAAGQRRLVDAQVAFALGDYDAAALMLFELGARPSPDQATATFYLAESLFHKGDRGAARAYYEQVVAASVAAGHAAGHAASKYYQPSLERLIEIAIAQRDDTGIGPTLAALDRISPGQRRPSVPYVRGKLAYAQGKHDEAIAYFRSVPKGSKYELPAAYYTATAHVANKQLQRAIDIFADLIGKPPRTANDRRVIELGQLALGRLYYERGELSKSIDSYLLVDRHSDLFPDALYEVAWVYVKSKQYDKALRALELLSRSDPTSSRTPTLRILEGNLRIRKAQMVRGAQIQGTLDREDPSDPAAEYDKAVQVFTETHDLYLPSYTALARMADTDPAQYLAQIAGRSEHVFQTVAPLPEAAVQYLREEPAVERVVAVTTDLGEIGASLAQTEATIARLERVLAARDSSAVYPALASRRLRIAEIQDDVIEIRGELADQALRIAGGSSALAEAARARRQLATALAAMPDAARAADAQRARDQARYDAIERSVAEVAGAIGAAQAVAAALRKYEADTLELPADQGRTVTEGRSEGRSGGLTEGRSGGRSGGFTGGLTRGLTEGLTEAARQAQAIERELAAVREGLQIGRDLARIGSEAQAAARAARAKLTAAQDAEHAVLADLARGGRGRDRGKLAALARLGDRAARLAHQLEQTDHRLDTMAAQGLQEIRVMLGQARADLDAYRAELGAGEAEARSIGGSALAASRDAVKAKLYDIVIRTDVGNVDVSWSRREDTDDDLKRLNLSRQRELRQLRDEFRGILDARMQAPSAPANEPERPGPQPSGPGGDPLGRAGDLLTPPGTPPGAGAPRPPAPPATRTEGGPKQGGPKQGGPKQGGPKQGGPKQGGPKQGGPKPAGPKPPGAPKAKGGSG